MTTDATPASSTKSLFILFSALLGACAMMLAGTLSAHAAVPAPIVVAHRGGSYTYPENTSPALLAAARRGQIVESDVRFTSDHVAVFAHDADTTRVFYCKGKNYVIARTTFLVLNRDCVTHRALSKRSASYHLARYSSVLSAMVGIPDVRIWPEIKTTLTHADARRFLEPLIAGHLISHTRITSFYGHSLLFIRQQALTDYHVRELHTLLYEAGHAVPLAEVHLYGVDAIGPSYFIVHANPNLVRDAHADGIAVAVYNADDPAHWESLRSLGVNWTITNHPNAYEAWAHS